MTLRPNTIVGKNGKKYHNISGIYIECSGQDCNFCKGETEISFSDWENSIPYPIPKKGRRYKNPLIQKNRGKTIAEICYSCETIPCYICKRTKCDQWMKEKAREGQKEGCANWENDRCNNFHCKKGIIKTTWKD